MNDSESGWAGAMIQWTLIFVLGTALLLVTDWVLGGVVPAWAYNVANPVMWLENKLGIVEWLHLDGVAAWIGHTGPGVAGVIGFGPLFACVALTTLVLLSAVAGIGARWLPSALLVSAIMSNALGHTRESILERRSERAYDRGADQAAERYLAKLDRLGPDRPFHPHLPARAMAKATSPAAAKAEFAQSQDDSSHARFRNKLLAEIDRAEKEMGANPRPFDVEDLATARAYLGDTDGARRMLLTSQRSHAEPGVRAALAIAEGFRGNVTQAKEDASVTAGTASASFGAIGVVLAHAGVGDAISAVEASAALSAYGKRASTLVRAALHALDSGHRLAAQMMLDAAEADSRAQLSDQIHLIAAWTIVGDLDRAKLLLDGIQRHGPWQDVEVPCQLALAHHIVGGFERRDELIREAEAHARDSRQHSTAEALATVAVTWHEAGNHGASRRIARELERMGNIAEHPLDRKACLTYAALVHARHSEITDALRIGASLSEGPDKRVLRQVVIARAWACDYAGAFRVAGMLPESHLPSLLRDMAQSTWDRRLSGLPTSRAVQSRRGRRATGRAPRNRRVSGGIRTTLPMWRMRLIACAVTLFVASTSRADIRFVDPRATGSGIGTSWQDAYPTLQDALVAARAPGSTIHELRVSEGTHKPDQGVGQTPGDQLASFHLVDGVAIRGGFRGLGPGGSPDDRDPAKFPTILTGDLLGNDTPGFVNYTENSAHVVRATGVGPTTVLDGLIITGGYGLIDPANPGAGLLLFAASPTLTNCTIARNLGTAACGMMSNGGSPTLTRCLIVENSGPPGGGAVGAGLYVVDGVLTLRECQFLRNEGRMITAKGAGLYRLRGLTIVDRCTFIGNTVQATQGGAMFLNDSNSLITNSLFVGNKASDLGGAVYVQKGSATIAGCSIVSNGLGTMVNGSNGGVFVHGGGSLTVTNSILSDNRPSFGGPTQASNLGKGSTSTLVVHYSCIQGWNGAFGGIGNHGFDPKFFSLLGADGLAGTGDEDLRLWLGSPCVDSGSNFLVPAGSVRDLAGVPRFVDDPLTPNKGVGSGPIVDMGAHETSWHVDLD